MAYFIMANAGMDCVFSKCDNPATVIYVHEFVNRPQKPMCEEHAVEIREIFVIKELFA